MFLNRPAVKHSESVVFPGSFLYYNPNLILCTSNLDGFDCVPPGLSSLPGTSLRASRPGVVRDDEEQAKRLCQSGFREFQRAIAELYVPLLGITQDWELANPNRYKPDRGSVRPSYWTSIDRRAKRFHAGPGHPRPAGRQHLGDAHKGANRDDRGLAAARPVAVPDGATPRRLRGSGPLPPPPRPRRSDRSTAEAVADRATRSGRGRRPLVAGPGRDPGTAAAAQRPTPPRVPPRRVRLRRLVQVGPEVRAGTLRPASGSPVPAGRDPARGADPERLGRVPP